MNFPNPRRWAFNINGMGFQKFFGNMICQNSHAGIAVICPVGQIDIAIQIN